MRGARHTYREVEKREIDRREEVEDAHARRLLRTARRRTWQPLEFSAVFSSMGESESEACHELHRVARSLSALCYPTVFKKERVARYIQT